MLMKRGVRKSWTYGLAVLMTCGALAPFAGAEPAAQMQSGTYMELDVESPGQTQHIRLSLGQERFRLDAGDEVSVVSRDDMLLMIQHAERSYIEFTAELMAGLAGMMGGQMPPQATPPAQDSVPPTFTRTGNTKNVGDWSAYEVRVEHPEQQGELSMWYSQDVDADFRVIAEQLITSLSPLLNNPMMARMGGGVGQAGMFSSIERQLSSLNMPDGFPVQVIANGGGQTNITTLRLLDPARAFDPSTWEAADGYQKMEFPFRR